jgi:hypothetical protein
MVGSVPQADTESVAFKGGDSCGVRATETMVRSLEPVIFVTFRVGTSADERNLLVVCRSTHTRKEEAIVMTVARVTELSAASPDSFEEAIKEGIEKGQQDLAQY